MENQLIIMTNKEAQRYDIIKNLINKKLTGVQAAKQLSLSTRQVKRIKKKVKEKGLKGIVHGNRGKQGNNKLNQKLEEKIIKHIKKNYFDFTSVLIKEKLQETHNIKVSYSTVRRIMIQRGLHKSRKRKKS